MDLWLNTLKIFFGPFSRQYNEEFRRTHPALSAASFGCSGISGYELADSFFSQPLLIKAKSSSLPAVPENILPLGQAPKSVKPYMGARPAIQHETSNGITTLQVTSPFPEGLSEHPDWKVRYSFINEKLYMTTLLLPGRLNTREPDLIETINAVHRISPGVVVPETAGQTFTYQQNGLVVQVVQGLFCNQIRMADIETLRTIWEPLLTFMGNKNESNLRSYLAFNFMHQLAQPA